MREVDFKVIHNKQIARDIYEMLLEGDTSDIVKPGQFVNIKLPYQYLRRPISICDYNDKEFTIIYKIVGIGTKFMSEISTGMTLSILSGLGNGYEIHEAGKSLLVGGGVGVAPLYVLAKKLLERNIKPDVLLGFNSIEDCFYVNKFQTLGLNVRIHIRWKLWHKRFSP